MVPPTLRCLLRGFLGEVLADLTPWQNAGASLLNARLIPSPHGLLFIIHSDTQSALEYHR